MFDSVQMTMSVTQERLSEIRQLVVNWLHRVSATRKQLESLIGKLLFVAKFILPDMLFIARLLDVLRGLMVRKQLLC